MTGKDRALALVVALMWGLNFPATVFALEHYPPLLMASLRFAVLVIPTVLFIPRPKVKLIWLLGTGFGLGIMQFAFSYLAMANGMPPGLASIVLQASAPFTIIGAGIFLGERLNRKQTIGAAVAVGGLVIIAVHRAQVAAFWPVALTLLAAAGWAIGNICSRQARAPKPLHLTFWISLVPPIPLFALSLLVEGPERIGHALSTSLAPEALRANLGLAFIVIAASIIGYGIWNTLLSRHPSNQVAPFSMLVPIFGVLSSWLVFDEVPSWVELSAGALVVGGVLFASLSWRRRGKVAPEPGAEPGAGLRLRAAHTTRGRRGRSAP